MGFTLFYTLTHVCGRINEAVHLVGRDEEDFWEQKSDAQSYAAIYGSTGISVLLHAAVGLTCGDGAGAPVTAGFCNVRAESICLTA